MPPKPKKCVKCELHGVNEAYSGGHVRWCLYKQCQCGGCQDHDRFLDIQRRERTKRREMMEKRRGENLLSQVLVKKLRKGVKNRRFGLMELPGDEASRLGDRNVEGKVDPILLSSDSEDFSFFDSNYQKSCPEVIDAAGDKSTYNEISDTEYPSGNPPKRRKVMVTNSKNPSPSSIFNRFSSVKVSEDTQTDQDTQTDEDTSTSDELPDPEDYCSKKLSTPTIKYHQVNLKLSLKASHPSPPRKSTTKVTTPHTTVRSPAPSCSSLLLSSPTPASSGGLGNTPAFVTISSSSSDSEDDDDGKYRLKHTPGCESLTLPGSGGSKKYSRSELTKLDEYSSIDELLDDSMEVSELEEYNEVYISKYEILKKSEVYSSDDYCYNNNIATRNENSMSKKESTNPDEISSDDYVKVTKSGSKLKNDISRSWVCKSAKQILKPHIVEKGFADLGGVNVNTIISAAKEDVSGNSLVVSNANDSCTNTSDDRYLLTTNINNTKLLDKENINRVTKDDISKVTPTVRWDVPPPGLALDQLTPLLPPIQHVVQLAVPHHLRGLLIGRGGYFIKWMIGETGTTVSFGPVYCTVVGTSYGVEMAMMIIQERLFGRVV